MAISDDPAPAGGTAQQAGAGVGDDVGKPDPEGGGCLKLGWGCLPVMAGILLLPSALFF